MPDPEPTPQFTPAAAALWRNVPAWAQAKVLANVYCSRCRHATTISDFRGEVVSGDLLLTGACQVCGTTVRRLIEVESEP